MAEAVVQNKVKRSARSRLRPYQEFELWLTRLFFWAFIPAVLFPVVWVFAVSFRAGDAFYSDSIWPEVWTLSNYTKLFAKTKFLLWGWNTVKVALIISAVQAFMTLTAAYAFSRMRFIGHRWGLTALLILQMFPATMSLASNYILLVRLGLFNSHLGYILISSGAGAYMIWFVKGYFDNIPKELDEAALVDGATRWQIFRYIMLPLVRPFIAVQVLWAIIGTFSEFMSASIFLKSPNLWLQAVGMQRMVGGAFQANQWPVFAAGAVMVSIPLVILWMFLQRHLIAGLTRGAVKG